MVELTNVIFTVNRSEDLCLF